MDDGDPRGPSFLPMHRAPSGGVERAEARGLALRVRNSQRASGGGVGAGHGALGLGFRRGRAVRAQGACARVRVSGGGWERLRRLEARALP